MDKGDLIPDALQALKYSNAIEVIDEVLVRNPAATVADVRRYASDRRIAAERLPGQQEAQIERAVCRVLRRRDRQGK